MLLKLKKYNKSIVMLKKIKYIILYSLLFAPYITSASQEVDKVVVNKTKSIMTLVYQGEIVKEYNVVFGANPKGHKQQEGDEKTPEGIYTLDYKKNDSAFYKAIHISYPNKLDIKRAKDAGVSPGGFIMIHGQKNGLGWLSNLSQRFNWTNGCIAVTNKEMDEIWKLVKIGTPIEILP